MQAGQVLGGRYRLGETLGNGGMSVVWRARDEVLGRDVAVKALAPKLASDSEQVARVRVEAQAAARLCHPHIVNVHDYGEVVLDEGAPQPYVVMELVEGPSLSVALEDGPLPWADAVRVCADVAEALAAAHAHGVVHRDVTPGNVMLTETGAKLVDFGISASVGEEDTGPGGMLLGTPAYFAPERLDFGQVQAASDVYALGLVLYKSLTGRLPWQTASTTQMLAAHRHVDPAPLPAVLGLPLALSQLCRRCLSKRPHERPTSAEAARVLRTYAGSARPRLAVMASGWMGRAAAVTASFVAGRPHMSPTAVMSAMSSRMPPSRRRLVITLAAVGLLLVTMLGGSWAGTNGLSGAGTAPVITAASVGARAVECKVGYEVRRDSGGGFAAGVTITNAGSVDVDRWRLEFRFPGDQRVVRGSAGRWQQSGHMVTVVGTGPAARLPAGRSLTVGFDGVYRSGNPLPTDFWLNGSECVPVLTFGGKGAGETTGDAGDEGGGSSKGAKKPKNNEHD